MTIMNNEVEYHKNIFYFYNVSSIGGIETFFYNLARKYKDWDITIYCRHIDGRQLARLSKYVRVKQYTGQQIRCEKAFFNFNLDIVDNVYADEYIQIAHGDYPAIGIKPNTHPKINRYIGVSQLVCDTYSRATGFETELCYNPIFIEKPRKVLNLICATRLTAEKGEERIKQLARALDDANIPYLLHIFSDKKDVPISPNIVYVPTRMNIIDYIAKADYLVQLSDAEGYCYSVVEALCVGTPVIVTDCPVFRELGVEHGKNGFILDFDMSNIPVEEIYRGLPKFSYTPKQDRWGELLAPGESTYDPDDDDRVPVQCIMGYFDIEMQRNVKEREVWVVPKERAEVLLGVGVVKIADIASAW